MVVDPETKRKGIETAVKVGVGVVGLAIAGPYVWMAFEGLMAVAVFTGAALLLWGIAPALATFVANKRIALLIKVIEANPIETMRNLYIEKQQEFRNQEQAVTDFETQFRNVSDMVDGLKKTDPDEAVQYAEMRDKMQEGLAELRAEQRAAQGELEVAKKTIDKMQRIWNVALAMNKALAASASAQQKVFDEIKNTVSIDTVRGNLNRAFANLNTAVERRKNGAMFAQPKVVAALPEAQPAQVIDLSKVRDRVTIR